MSTETKKGIFLNTMTLQKAASVFDAEKLDVLHQPETPDKLFFQLGSIRGAVAKSLNPKDMKEPMISKVKGEPTDQQPDGIFFLLHEQGAGSAVSVATINF